MSYIARQKAWLCAATVTLAVACLGVWLLASDGLVHGSDTTTIQIGSGEAESYTNVTVRLEALDLPAPGLGSYVVNVHYDSSVGDPVDCVPDPGDVIDTSFCNTDYAPEVVRCSGFDPEEGLTGQVALCDITFHCVGEQGECSDLSLNVSELYATDGTDILPDVQQQDGSVCCMSCSWSDTDGDSCTDCQEGQTGPGAELRGGNRDPGNPCDFYDVPVPILHSGGTLADRDKAITIIGDLLAVLTYGGASQTCPATDTCGTAAPPNSPGCCTDNANGNGIDYDEDMDGDTLDTLADGLAYDRSPGVDLDGDTIPDLSDCADGSITIIEDLLLVLAQAGHSCQAVVRMGSGDVPPGESITVPLEALAVAEPGLGAATVDIGYDPDVVDPTDWSGGPNFDMVQCSLDYTPNIVRCTAISATGAPGNSLVADITFQAVGQAGQCSVLDVAVVTFTDPDGNPIPVAAEDGRICITP